MIPTITAFERSPDEGKGLARDMRVRWALEEVGRPYDVRLVSFTDMKEPAHRSIHPFGQIPTYEEGNLALFETGAIILHIAQHDTGLLPDDPNARARAITWMFAALNTVEPPIIEHEQVSYLERDKPWYEERLPMLEDRIRERLEDLSNRLGDADWLDGAFTAGDLTMVMVLRRLDGMGIMGEYPHLSAYVARAEARPAYRRAFDAQLAVFTGVPSDDRQKEGWMPLAAFRMKESFAGGCGNPTASWERPLGQHAAKDFRGRCHVAAGAGKAWLDRPLRGGDLAPSGE